jgi:hypothetical protein
MRDILPSAYRGGKSVMMSMFIMAKLEPQVDILK